MPDGKAAENRESQKTCQETIFLNKLSEEK